MALASQLSFAGTTVPISVQPYSAATHNTPAKIRSLAGLGYDAMAVFVAGLGFDGIDLTVRKGGHALPEHVERDLPVAVKAARQQGLSIYMIATDILYADEPFTERILKTASSPEIQHYRMRKSFYDAHKSINANLNHSAHFPGLAFIF